MQLFRPKNWTAQRVLRSDELPSDPVLPQLDLLLDSQRMAGLFQQALPGKFSEGRYQVERCCLLCARYKPTRYCRLVYGLECRDTDSGELKSEILVGRVFCKAPSERYKARQNAHLSVVPSLGFKYAYLPELKFFLSVLPNDLAIPGLHKLTSAAGLESTLLAALRGEGLGSVELKFDLFPHCIISYKPERSCLFHCQVRHARQSAGSYTDIFGRCYHDLSECTDTYNIMDALWRSPPRLKGEMAVAEPLGYDRETLTSFQGALPGQIMTAFIGRDRFVDYLGQAGRCLAFIHRTPVDVGRGKTPEGELQTAETFAANLQQASPLMGKRLTGILEQLRDRRSAFGETPRCLIHGDFSTNQLLISGKQVGVIDFDAAGIGDPLMDIGSFLARLDCVPGASEYRILSEFCRHYDRENPGIIEPERLRWYRVLGFTKYALSALKQLKPGWTAIAADRLSRAEALLGEAASQKD